ncbi:MAG TPA: MarR family transcriptional regulator [Gemmatimonadaceae bacterium]
MTPTRLAPAAAAEIARTCACFSVRKATRAITQLYDDVLRPSGLRATQFTLLVMLAGMGPISVGELADAAVIDRTTLTRNLALLEERGLIEIEPGEDARVRLVALRPEGHQAITAALPLWERAQAALAERVGESRVARLRESLDAVTGTHSPAATAPPSAPSTPGKRRRRSPSR